ncbi:hypothetical protein PanWU01x14_175480 [Parasponia andersonii]|uniref:Uncharacterized protein n=1 Tax=Parasponia andersonii TaxID=3476 RepID=A0A2P5C8F8_PARAD|nr:hypothetical protein PanWU01x14_175480 [Parasponia andersonii]
MDIKQNKDPFEFHPLCNNTTKEEVIYSSTYAIEDRVILDEEDHSRSLDDCFNEVIEDGILECSRPFLDDHLEKFKIGDTLDISKLLAQEVNISVVKNGDVELDDEKLREIKDSKHVYISLGKETSAEVELVNEAIFSSTFLIFGKMTKRSAQKIILNQMVLC